MTRTPLRHPGTWLIACGVAALALVPAVRTGGAGKGAAVSPAPTAAPVALPVVFEPNAGRAAPSVRFLARGPGYSLQFGDRETRVTTAAGATVSSRLAGARPAPVEGSGPPAGRLNSYAGKDPRRWVRGAPLFGSVVQRGVYPGIDLVHRGSGSLLEYDFEVAPGADPGRIAIDLAGARPRLGLGGDLTLRTPAGTLVQHKPVAYQQVGGRRVSVDAAFRLHGRRVRFDVGSYDSSRPLVIDPVLSYSTFLGASSSQRGLAVATGPDRSAFVAGETSAADFPQAPAGDYGGGSTDGFVAKIAPGGGSVEWITYLGGDGADQVNGVDVDAAGNAFLAGTTGSSDLPVPGGLFATERGGSKDGFVARLGSDGAIAWSTYLGGDGDDEASAVHVSDAGLPTVVGYTSATSVVAFPTAGTSTDSTYGGGAADGFVTTFAADGTSIVMSSFLGGSLDDRATAVTHIGADPDPLLAGTTFSTNFPTTATPLQANNAGGSDMFVALLDDTTGSLGTSTYVGGSGDDEAYAIAATAPDPELDFWVAGATTSDDVMLAAGHHGATGYDGVAVRLDTTSQVVYMGGTAHDTIYAAAADKAGNVIFGGMTQSSPFSIGATPLTSLSPIDSTRSATTTGWVAKFDGDTAAGNLPLFATYLGGTTAEWVNGIAADDGTGFYSTGFTNSDDFPTADPLQPLYGEGGNDAFLTKMAMAPITFTGPSGVVTNNTTAQFKAITVEPDPTFECQLAPLEGGAFSCGATKTYTSLADGPYTYKMRVFDATGNTDGFNQRQFVVDTQAPADFALKAPAEGATTGTQPAFSWDAAADTNGVSSYRLEIDGTPQQVDAASACAGGVCQATASVVTGAHNWRVVAVDPAGNEKASGQRGFTALEPPTARFAISPNPALAGRAVSFDGAGSVDANHTIARYEWDLDGDGGYETDGGSSSTASRTYNTPQTVNIGLRVTDGTGLTGESRQELRVTTQIIPGQFGVSINKGAQYTRTPDVTITAVFPASITTMLFSNDGGFFTPTTFKPAAQTKWKLDSSGPERLPKIVYVRFLTGPLTSETHTDDIILDETPPKVTTASLLGGIRPAAGTAAAKRRTFKLKLKASDSNSGVAGVQVTANKRKPGKLLRYKRTLKVKLTARPRFVRARDRAGNYSKWRKVAR